MESDLIKVACWELVEQYEREKIKETKNSERRTV